ncbi:type II secretion system protein [candidate division WOR-3 bacterium]|nr:type II secretion system protein [candidate division WOR-3 bacterium]
MKKNSGFTFVELIVSILIFSITMTGVVLFSAHNNRSNLQSERKAQKAIIQEKTVEEFRNWLLQFSATRFDTIWNDHSTGDIIYADTDAVKKVASTVVLKSFIPDSSISPSASGSRMEMLVISRDISLNTTDSFNIIISKHR